MESWLQFSIRENILPSIALPVKGVSSPSWEECKQGLSEYGGEASCRRWEAGLTVLFKDSVTERLAPFGEAARLDPWHGYGES